MTRVEVVRREDAAGAIELELQRFISEEVTLSEVAVDTPLIESGAVDSMGLLQILAFIDRRFGVDLMRAGNPRDFRSVLALAEAVRREGGGGGT
jgi:acyl carrier protein